MKRKLLANFPDEHKMHKHYFSSRNFRDFYPIKNKVLSRDKQDLLNPK